MAKKMGLYTEREDWWAGQMSKAIQKQLVEVDRLQRGGEYTLRSGLGGWDRCSKLKLTDG